MANNKPSPQWLMPALRASFGLAGALPWVLPYARAYLPMGPLGSLLDGMFIFVCHRRPERTLLLSGVPMPLCSRCAGIAAGFFLGAVIARPVLTLNRIRLVVVVTGALMLLDVIAQDLHLHPFWHWSRLLTGALFGYALSVGVFSIAKGGIRAQGAVSPAENAR